MREMRQFVYQPGGALRRYVREILWIWSEHPRIQILLPETTLTLVLRQSGRASLNRETLPNAIVSRLQQRTRLEAVMNFAKLACASTIVPLCC